MSCTIKNIHSLSEQNNMYNVHCLSDVDSDNSFAILIAKFVPEPLSVKAGMFKYLQRF